MAIRKPLVLINGEKQQIPDTDSVPNADKLDGKTSTYFATAVHTHMIDDVTNLQTELNNKSNIDHNHDTQYLGKTEKAADSDKLDGNDSTYFATATDLTSHTTDTNNPHNVTAAQLGAANILTQIKTVDGAGSGLDADLLDGKDSSVFAEIGLAPDQIGTNKQSIGLDVELIRRDLFTFNSPGANVPQVIKIFEFEGIGKSINGTIRGARSTKSSATHSFKIQITGAIISSNILRLSAITNVGQSILTTRLINFEHNEKTWVGIEISGTTDSWYPTQWVFDGYYAGDLDLEAVPLSEITNITDFIDVNTYTRYSGRHNFTDYMPQAFGSPIVASGSNANGEWVRFADGTQVATNSNNSITTAPITFVGTITKIDNDKLWIGRWY